MACTEPIKCFKILEDCKHYLLTLYDIDPCSINCISFTGSWLSSDGSRRSIPMKYLEQIQIPCRKCDGCRLAYARQWSLKGMLEFQYFDNVGCFITLTYDDDHLPSFDLADCAKDFQDFMKRLRKKFKGKKAVVDKITGEITYPIRYLHCGEYGSLNKRPHHHAILFNFDFPDKSFRRISDSGYAVYYDKELLKLWSERVWTGEYEDVIKTYVTKDGTIKNKKYKRKVYKYIPKGKCEIGLCTYKSISYVARYVTKKVYGDDADSYYNGKKPDYITMSRKPGIAKYWFDEHYFDMYTYDTFTLKGVPKKYAEHKPPKSFDVYFERLYPDTFKEIKAYRKEMAIANSKDSAEQFRENKARAFKFSVCMDNLVRPLDESTDYCFDEREMLQNDSCFRI